MRFIDSHCHLDQLDLTPYAGDLSRALNAAEKQGVFHFLCVCITLQDFPAMFAIAKSDSRISVSLGLHPNEIVEKEPTEEELISLASDKKVIAIGETGLDYYRSAEKTDWQQERFRRHIRVAKKLNKPLIIHMRNAAEDTIRILREENAASVGGVMHCFTENEETAKSALDLGFYISFSGIVTFRNATAIQAVAKQVPLNRILIETDSPYLAPVPYRGKSNEPAYVRYVAESIALLRGLSIEDIAQCTTDNFFSCFRLPKVEPYV